MTRAAGAYRAIGTSLQLRTRTESETRRPLRRCCARVAEVTPGAALAPLSVRRSEKRIGPPLYAKLPLTRGFRTVRDAIPMTGGPIRHQSPATANHGCEFPSAGSLRKTAKFRRVLLLSRESRTADLRNAGFVGPLPRAPEPPDTPDAPKTGRAVARRVFSAHPPRRRSSLRG